MKTYKGRAIYSLVKEGDYIISIDPQVLLSSITMGNQYKVYKNDFVMYIKDDFGSEISLLTWNSPIWMIVEQFGFKTSLEKEIDDLFTMGYRE